MTRGSRTYIRFLIREAMKNHPYKELEELIYTGKTVFHMEFNNQHINMRVFPKKRKETAGGVIPLYLRITAGCKEADISLGSGITNYEEWDPIERNVLPSHPNYGIIRNHILKVVTGVTTIFERLTSGNGNVTAMDVKSEYDKQEGALRAINKIASATPTDTPAVQEPQTLSEKVDHLIVKVVELFWAKEKEKDADVDDHKTQREKVLEDKRQQISNQARLLEIEANRFFDDTSIPKTLINAVDECMLQLTLRVIAGTRSFQTLRHWQSDKTKIRAFLLHRHGVHDLPLEEMKFKHTEQYYDFLTLHNENCNNTAMKHVKNLKQVVERAANMGWVSHNLLRAFKCRYDEPDKEGIIMQDVSNILNTDFKDASLNRVRDVFIFGCFTGYAYQDLKALSPAHIVTGIDGKKWLQLNRGKTNGKEDVPVLRLPELIMEKYRDHPLCLRKKRLLPVPSNRMYNLLLKKIAEKCGITRDLTTHIARHTFATTIALENDVPLPTVQKMLGHNSIRTTEKYAKVTRVKVSRNMERLDTELFDADGALVPMDEYYKRAHKQEPKPFGGLRVVSKTS